MAECLYLDCSSGASGDMLLGALIDVGVPVEAIGDALGSLRLEGVGVEVERVVRAGISAVKFRVLEGGGEADAVGDRPGHADHHHHENHAHADHQAEPPRRDARGASSSQRHQHRHLPQILSIIERSALSPAARLTAAALVERLAAAEAAIHGIPIERVHLHEVGAIDSIVDIVGAVHALELLGVTDIWSSPLNTGSGTVRCAHGVYPVPAPATLRLVSGAPVYAEGPAVELLTPTGALLVTAYAKQYGPMPAMVPERVGYGAGTRDFKDRPNVLRAVLGRRADQFESDTVLVLECEVDDMNPQFFGPFLESCLAAGAYDVYYTPIFMKKNRPGTLVTILAPVDRRERLTALVFRETTSIGVRYHERQRACLSRRVVTVSTAWGDIRVKVASSSDAVLNAAPEFDDCVRVAREHRVAVKAVHTAALHAYLNVGSK